MGLPTQILALLPGLCLGLSWAAGIHPTMGNSTILGISTTGTTTSGNNATTETPVGNNATTKNRGTPGHKSTLGNSAATENNGTSDNITSGTTRILGSNVITGSHATTETKASEIHNIVAETHTTLGSQAQGNNHTTASTTAAGIHVLGSKTMGNSVTIRVQAPQNNSILGSTTTDSQIPESSAIWGNSSTTENQATENSAILGSSSSTGHQAMQNNDIWGSHAIIPENVIVGNASLASVSTGNNDSLGINTHSGNSTPLETSAPTENKTLENVITENNTAVGNSSTTGSSSATLGNNLTIESHDILGNKISENVTLGTVSTENSVSLGINEDTLGTSATTEIQVLKTSVTMGSASTGSKALENNISPLENDTLCWGPGINEMALCGGEPSSGESTDNISLREFICNKTAQGSLLTREELDMWLSRVQCKDSGVAQTLTLIFSYANLTELQDALGQLNDSACHGVTMKALWTVMLQGRLDFKDTQSLHWWFQVLLRPFLALLAREDLRCLPLGTLDCKQYQAM